MNKRRVLDRAREMSKNHKDKEEGVFRDAYFRKYGREIEKTLLAGHIHNLKTRGKVADYLADQIVKEAEARRLSARSAPRAAAA